MATAYEKIRQRKIIYLAAILVLLGISWVHRTMVIEKAAERHDLTETNLGKVDLGGSISRFVLSSFRGPLVCGLWWDAIDQQKKHNFNQLELLVKALTKLQPHFKGPWKFQGWNLAYNVSVEFDRAQDKYFYISKGMRWLANGEETNRLQLWDEDQKKMRPVGDPEMRQEIAQYLYNKMYYADENSIYRPFLHMSCIPKSKRDPVRLRNNPALLTEFKQRYKRFVRRVRDYHILPDGDEAVLDRYLLKFLEDHQDVPCLWKEEGTSITVTDDPWPRWPNMKDLDFLGKVQDQEQSQDGVDISRIWYDFSTEPLPPPRTELSENVTPESDRFHRINKNMHSMIFRASPYRARCIYGQELDKEGWPDDGQKAWEEGYEGWRALGRACNLEHPRKKIDDILEKARYYHTKYKDRHDSQIPPPDFLKEQNPEEYQRALDGYKAVVFINNLEKLKVVCRYQHWVETSRMHRTDVHREAERARYLAQRRATDWPVARAHYERALALFMLLLRQELVPEEQIALRLTMLTPSTGTLLAQTIPPVSNRLSWYAMDETTQEQMVLLEDAYLRVLAKERGPARFQAEHTTWVLKQALASATASAATPTAALLTPAAAIVPPSILNIAWIEDLIETSTGPFGELINQSLRDERLHDRKLGKD
jgi:hypothetical protein